MFYTQGSLVVKMIYISNISLHFAVVNKQEIYIIMFLFTEGNYELSGPIMGQNYE